MIILIPLNRAPGRIGGWCPRAQLHEMPPGRTQKWYSHVSHWWQGSGRPCLLLCTEKEGWHEPQPCTANAIVGKCAVHVFLRCSCIALCFHRKGVLNPAHSFKHCCLSGSFCRHHLWEARVALDIDLWSLPLYFRATCLHACCSQSGCNIATAIAEFLSLLVSPGMRFSGMLAECVVKCATQRECARCSEPSPPKYSFLHSHLPSSAALTLFQWIHHDYLISSYICSFLCRR